MHRVLLTTCYPSWPIARQTPGRLGVWEDFEFIIDKSDVTCDAWVVVDSPLESVRATCNPDNLFFVTAEPPELRTYRRDFVNQFRWVVTCHKIRHRGLILAQQAHPWHVGINHDDGLKIALDYDSLSKMSVPNKPRLISTVISNKAITPAHRQRLEFVQRLKRRLGDAFTVWGRGHQSIADKWDAVAPYRFHLVLENASHPHYMTEKISDAFLGSSFPFYYGAPNASDEFPQGSFEAIDIFQPEVSIDKICAAIDNHLDAQRRVEVAHARRIVLDQLNLFPMLVRLLREKIRAGTKHSLRVYPKNRHVQLALSGFSRYMRRAA